MDYVRFEEKRDRQFKVAILCTEILEQVLMGVFTGEDGPDVLGVWSRNQREHIEEYVRLSHDPELPEYMKQMGDLLDRTLIRICTAIDAWEDIDHIRKARKLLQKHRQEVVVKREEERAARIAARKARRLEITGIQPIEYTPIKRERHEVVRCSKCGKRPPTHGTLCTPCAQWGASQL